MVGTINLARRKIEFLIKFIRVFKKNRLIANIQMYYTHKENILNIK